MKTHEAVKAVDLIGERATLLQVPPKIRVQATNKERVVVELATISGNPNHNNAFVTLWDKSIVEAVQVAARARIEEIEKELDRLGIEYVEHLDD